MKRHGSMNHIYRLIWSQISNTWVAVAETARGKGKGGGRRKLIAAALSLTAVTITAPYAQAGPTGGQVVSGSGTITQSGALTTIKQNSQNLSLNWNTFNIAPTETVNFVQPTTSSVAVNRIFDTNGSLILGHLNANGQVYLINPNGVVFGAGSQVNVGGLVASTLDVDNASGNTRTFSGSGNGSVVNEGTINAASGGYVALLGNHVSNQGTITAQLGTVALGAGNAVTLTFNGNDLVHMQVNQSVLNSLAENGGLIRADGGTVVMNAGAANALLASVVNNTGVIEARTVNQQEGSITLLGGMTAGTVNVGGTLDASAPNNGGNGGAIETSAANVLVGNDAKVTTASTSGLAGSWLIDPTNFTISSGSGAQTASGIGATTLQTNLGSGNVAITTSAVANGSDLGDINVNAAVTWSTNKLTLTAANNVNINAVMTANNASLDLEPGSNVNVGFNAAGGFSGQVNFFQANGTTPRAGTGFLTINGHGYTVITTLSGLQGMGTLSTDYYALGVDITGGSFTPIGSNTATFAGHFDGLGNTISNLAPINETSTGTGLFGGVSGTVQNVGLVGGSVSVSGSNYTGSLVGANYGTIRNSYSTANVTASNSSEFVGGLVGFQYGGVTTNSYATGTVSGDASTANVGGLVGYDLGGTISNSHATGNVTGTSAYVGGLAGQNRGSTISNSYATGNVSGSNYVGGLVGLSQASGAFNSTISNSYATGNVSGTNSVGGLVGANYGSTYGAFTSTISNSYSTLGTVTGSTYVGGLVGLNAGNYGGGTISNSYSTGAVSGTTHIGGLVGSNTATSSNPNNSVVYTGTVSNSFWDTTTSGRATSSGGKGMTTANMETVANFISSTPANGFVNPGWNFPGTWAMSAGSYPMLTAFLTPLTITASNVSTVYTGLTYAGAGEGVTYSVTPNMTYLSGSLSYGGSAQSAVNVTGSPYVITPSGLSNNSQQGYLVTYVNGSLTITPAPLTVTGLSGTGRAYNGSTVDALSGTAVLSGLVNSETLTLSNAASGTLTSANAGSEAITAAIGLVNGTGLASNYSLTQPTLSNVTITQAPLTVTGLSGTGRTYNGSTVDALTGTAVLSGLVNSETLTLSNAASGTLTSANAGSEAVTSALGLVSGTGLAANYSLTQPTLSNVTITQAPLTVTGLSGTGRTYNGSTVDALTGTGVLSGLVNSETLTLSNSASGTLASANAGSEAITSALGLVSGTGLAANYSLTQPTLSNVTITQAPLTVTGLSGTGRAYNGSTVDALTGTAVLSGLVNSETLTLSNAASGTLTSANAGSEAVTSALGLVDGTGLAANYSLTQPTLSNVTITQAPLTVTGLSGTGRTYNGSTVDALSGAGVLSGLVNSETLTLSNSASGTLTSANAGSEAVTSALGLVSGTGLAANYSLTQPTLSNVTITQAPLTVTGLSGTGRTYNGSTVDALTGTAVLSGLVNSETLTLSNAASGTLTSANAGSEAVTSAIGLVSGTGLAANYSLTQPTLSNVTITQAPLTVTGLSGTGRAYNGSTVDALTGTGVLSGLVNSETLTLSNSASGTLSSANAGSEAVTSALGLVDGTGLAANYSLTQPTLSNVTITQAPLTVTGLSGTGRAYNGSTVDAFTGTGVLSGLVNSETLTLSNSASGTLASANAGSQAVTSALGLVDGTGLAANYSLTQPTLSNVTITQAPLTVTGLSGTGRTYNGSTVDALTGTGVLSGLVNSETLTLSNAASGTLASANAGSEAITSALGLVSGTGLAANYSLTQPTLSNVTITQAPLTVTGLSGTGRTYNGSTVDALTGTAVLSGLVNSEMLTLSNDTNGTLVSAHAGNQAVTTSIGLVDGTGLAANYSLTQPTLSNVSITPAPVTVSLSNVANATKTYDGTAAAPSGFSPTYSFTGLLGGDSATASGATPTFNSAHVVSATAITQSGLSLTSISGSDGSLVGDYTLSNTSVSTGVGVASITAATLMPLLANSGVTKTYDGTTNAPAGFTPTYSFSGLVSGDTGATLTDTSAAYNSAHVASATGVTISGLALTGVTGSNGSLTSDYTLGSTSANVAATITAAPLTATATIGGAATKVFDGTTAATGATVSGSIADGAIAGDTLALNTSGISLNYNSSQTTATTISATGSTSFSIASSTAGSLASDYDLTQPVIAPVPGTITAASTPPIPPTPPTPPATTVASTIPSPILIVFQPSTQPAAVPGPAPSNVQQQIDNQETSPDVTPDAGASGNGTVDVAPNTTIDITPGLTLHLLKGGVRLPDNLVTMN